MKLLNITYTLLISPKTDRDRDPIVVDENINKA